MHQGAPDVIEVVEGLGESKCKPFWAHVVAVETKWITGRAAGLRWRDEAEA